MDQAPLGRDYSKTLQKQTRAIEARLRHDKRKRVFDLRVPGPANVVLGFLFLITGSWVLLTLNLAFFIVYWDDVEW